MTEQAYMVTKQGHVIQDKPAQDAQKFTIPPVLYIPPGLNRPFFEEPMVEPIAEPVVEPVDEYATALDEARALGDALRDMGVTHYEIIPSGYSNMCDTCQRESGEVRPIEEYIAGETAPPFHPNCGFSVMEYVPEVSELFPLDIVDEVLNSGRVLAVRYDERDKQNPVAINIIIHDGLIAFTTAAMSCDDGILTDEQYARRSGSHRDSLALYDAEGLYLNPYEVPYVVLPLGNQSFQHLVFGPGMLPLSYMAIRWFLVSIWTKDQKTGSAKYP